MRLNSGLTKDGMDKLKLIGIALLLIVAFVYGVYQEDEWLFRIIASIGFLMLAFALYVPARWAWKRFKAKAHH